MIFIVRTHYMPSYNDGIYPPNNYITEPPLPITFCKVISLNDENVIYIISYTSIFISAHIKI